MVSKEIISKSIEIAIIGKCRPTLSEMQGQLNSWSQRQKDTLIRYAFADTLDSELLMEAYHIRVENDTDEELFDYERQIFERLSKRQRDNILKYLTDFETEKYQYDDDVGYPNNIRGDLEEKMEYLQEEQGYSEDIIKAVQDYWTAGWYSEVQDYIMNKNIPDDWRSTYADGIKKSSKDIMEYIKNSIGLDTDTVLYRVGHWDIGTQVGDVKTTPCLNSTSYSMETALEIGEFDPSESSHYMITVYASKGTKGMMVNAPSLSHNFPEHEYLLNKGQRYIVLNVDDIEQTASILLLDD